MFVNLMIFFLCLFGIIGTLITIADWRDRRKFVKKDMSLFEYLTGKEIPTGDYPRKEIIP